MKKGLSRFSLITAVITTVAVLIPAPALVAESIFDTAEDLTLETSVVMIRAVSQDYDYVTPWKQRPMSQGIGSGFVIEGNRVLTNAHNVSNNRYVELKKQNLAKRYPARIEFIAHDCDLAILIPEDESFFDNTKPLEIGDIPKINSTVQTYGFPVGGSHVSVTEGVVSRIHIDTYSHSGADSHLVVQTDAAINPGNSGGPVIQLGKVVGVAFQGLTSADNIGYMIPTTVIRHFLEDIEDGTYHGFGSVGFSFFSGLQNPAYAQYLRVPPEAQGIVITSVQLNSSIEGILQPDDVITRIDNFDIDNDGMIKVYNMVLHMSEAIEQKQIGDTLEIEYYRNGEKRQTTATVALNRPVLAYWREYDNQPGYYVYGGLTFAAISRNYLETWPSPWITKLPFYLRYLFIDSQSLNDRPERKEYVVLSQILPDPINSYIGGYRNSVVEKVNGKMIDSLNDLENAFSKNTGEFTTISFMDSASPIVLKTEQAKARNEIILEKYNVPAKNNLN